MSQNIVQFNDYSTNLPDGYIVSTYRDGSFILRRFLKVDIINAFTFYFNLFENS